MSVLSIIRSGTVLPCRPWPRHLLSQADWIAMTAALAGKNSALLGLWADTTQVYALLRQGGEIALASVAVESGRYPAWPAGHPAAAWSQRMIRDLWGHAAEGDADDRPWLDHGRWPLARPLSPRPGLPGGAVDPPAFPALDAAGAMQVPLGPIRGVLEEPLHLRLATEDATVRRAEARLGYAHKGTLALMRGKSPRAAARFMARLAAEATVAHSLAFARAAEAALDTPAPPRAAALRVVMLEHERVAGHLDDLGRMAEAAGLASLQAALGGQCEQWRRAADLAFGHRLMMDAVVPGGIGADIAADRVAALRLAAVVLAHALPVLHRLAGPLLARLEGVGVIVTAAPGGVVGRAAGLEARVGDPAAAAPRRPAERAGDAAARCRVRLHEIADSLDRIHGSLEDLPDGPVAAALPAETGEGLGCAESLRGAAWHWLLLDHGQIAAAFPVDPGWLLWPLAEAAMAGGTLEDATMIRLSCSLPVSGLDL